MKKITSFLLAFVFIFTIFAATSVESYAAYTTAPEKTEAQVVEKINKLVSLLSGKYFTVNQKACSSSNCDNWACSNCYNSNVFAATWFKNIFGTVSTSQIPGHAYPGGGSGSPAGWTCHGFANFAMWYVFATNNTNKVSYTRVVDNITMTKANIEKYLKPGDIIRYNTHSLMFVSAGANSFTAVDCNYYGDYKVSKHTVPYSSKTIAVSRAKNYATTPTLSINYNVNGGVIKGSEVTATKYKVTESIGINMRSGAGTNYSKVTALPVNTVFTVKAGETATANGYTWGKTTYGSYTGWVVISDFVTKTGTETSTDSKYYVNNSLVYVTSTSAIHTQKLTYGTYISSGLYNVTTFGLTRDGYVFKGWSTAKTGAEIIDQDRGLKPEEIVPDLKNGSKTITLYAIWEPEHTHSYGEAIPYDDVNHMQSCSCGDSIFTEHDFEQSYVNIKSNGTVEIVYGCVDCGSSYTEISEEHSMTEWAGDENGETHSRHCVCGCGISETDYHFMVISDFVGENQGSFVCWDCGAVKIETLTDGLYFANGVMYYFENGKKVSGWFEVDGVTYYASSTTYVVINYSKTIGGKYYIWNDETGLEIADGFVFDGTGYKCYENGIN
ncbi:MAG: hypothetical protein E7675_06565, partial [Ruminococcaceae bacterium]|nr:hypothetical protein [Oscillospiraceae bacterium]